MLFSLFMGGELAAQVYCTSNATSNADTEIDNVTFNTINNSTAGICAMYSNFTAISTVVNIGQTVNLSVTVGTCGGSFTKACRVFIDWNRDGDFLDTGEIVYTSPTTGTTTTFSTTVTVPGTALIGATRLRVVCMETGTPTSILSCGTFTWGETEDYTVNINPSAPNDMGVSTILEPTSGCNLSAVDTVKVVVNNYGTNAQSNVPVFYRINGGAIVAGNTGPASIASGASVTYAFPTTANLSVPGTYTIKSWTGLVGDAAVINDSSTRVVVSIPGVSSYPYFENFEGGAGGWVASGTNSTWAFGTPAKTTINSAGSGVNSWVTGGLSTGSYANNDDSQVIGPCFDFTSLVNPWISLKVWWNSESSWDGAVLQSSTDFGTTWQTVGAFGDPNNWFNFQNIISQPGGQGDGWCGRNSSLNGSGGWLVASHALDGLGGQPSVRLRIAFGSDGSVVDDGFAFDDVRIGEGPVPNLGPDILICTSDTAFLNPGNFAAYFWNTGTTSQVDTVTISGAGIIAVTVVDTMGFTGRDTVRVSVSIPIVDLGPDTLICPGDLVTFDAGNPNASFSWSNGDTTQTISVGAAGTYTVNLVDSVGCPATDSVVVTVAVPPALNLGPDQTICLGQAVQLDAGGGPVGTTYSWNTGANTQVLVVSAPGTYIASVVTPGGCAAIDTIQVLNNPSPAVALGPDRTECGPFTLDAGPNPGGTYAWSTGGAGQTITANAGGSYAVTVTNSFGCSKADTIVISMATPPTVNLGPSQPICNGQTIVLDAGNPGSTYLWSNSATSQTISVTVPGLYIVAVTAPNGCISADSINISASNLQVNLGPDMGICGGQTVTLNAGNTGANFQWSNGQTTQTITTNTPGTYTVTVTDGSGCNATDQIVLTSAPSIVAGINGPGVGTLFGTTQFNDNSTGGPTGWIWDFGDGTTSNLQNPTHVFAAFGTYQVVLIAHNGVCYDTTSHTIVVNNFIGIDESMFAVMPQVFPNPSSGIFNLRMELLETIELSWRVLDVQGREVIAKEPVRGTQFAEQIDLSMLPSGFYSLELRVNGNPAYVKLIKQ